MTTAAPTITEDRALTLLGQGLGPEVVSAAVGVSVSAISQLLSRTDFAAKVAELRFKNLSKHNERDNRYDLLEEQLIQKMEDLMPFMVRPMEVAKVLQIINSAKRRGASAPDHITQQQTVIQLSMPVNIVQRYQVNTMNQVIQAGQQPLLTVQSSQMAKLLDKSLITEVPRVEHHHPNASQNG